MMEPIPTFAVEKNSAPRTDHLNKMMGSIATVNVVSFSDSGPLPEQTPVYFQQEVAQLDNWITFKVKAEITRQIFAKQQEGNDHFQADIATIQKVILREMATEKSESKRKIVELEQGLIPLAQSRLHADPERTGYFARGDVPNLRSRTAISRHVVELIEDIESRDEDSLWSLAEHYAQMNYQAASNEAKQIKKEKDEEELRRKNSELEKEIESLNFALYEKELSEDDDKDKDEDEKLVHPFTDHQ